MKSSNQVVNEGSPEEQQKDRRMLTLFLVLFPSIIIAGDWTPSITANIGLKVLLIFYQFVILKHFLDRYYGYD